MSLSVGGRRGGGRGGGDLLVIPCRCSHGPSIGEAVHLAFEFLRILYSRGAFESQKTIHCMLQKFDCFRLTKPKILVSPTIELLGREVYAPNWSGNRNSSYKRSEGLQ